MWVIPEPTQGRDIVAAFRATRLPWLLHEMDRRVEAFAAAHTSRALTSAPEEQGDNNNSSSSTMHEDRHHHHYRDRNNQLQHESRASRARSLSSSSSPYFRSTRTQTILIARRCVLNRLRDPMATWVSVMSAMIFALLVGSMYFQLGLTQPSIRNRMGVLFFTVMITTFSSLGSLELFLKDRAMYSREHRNGVYCACAFFVGKIIQDVPINVVINGVFNAMVYVMVGLQPSLVKFVLFDLVCMLLMLNSYAMCLFLSNVAKDFAVANVVASLTLVLFLLPSGGMLVSLDSIPLLWRWIKYISFVRYGFAVLVANEFDGLEFSCDDANRSFAPPTPTCIQSGTLYAASQGFRVEDNARYICIVAVSFVVYLLLAFLVLRYMRSHYDK